MEYFVHRIVMLAFIGQSELQVNHKNGIKTDNRLENLEYVTRSENVRHAFETGLMKRKRRVSQYTKTGYFIREFDSIKEASENTGAKKSSISRASRGISKSTKGFIWKLS